MSQAAIDSFPGAQAPRIPVVQILPGEFVCTAKPRLLTTVLGSCVAVCLWDRVRSIGGMNHFVLPTDPGRHDSARYGDIAIGALVSGMLDLGALLADLDAKLFGGAAVLPTSSGESVGTSNVRYAVCNLHQQGIRLVGQRTGGTQGQQVRFRTDTGIAFVRALPQPVPFTPPGR